MSASTWVQLVRNLACVLTVFLPENSTLLAPLFPHFSSPFSSVSAMGWFIAASQVGAIFLYMQGGYVTLMQSYKDITRLQVYKSSLDQYQLHTERTEMLELLIYRHLLAFESRAAWRTIFAGVCECLIGYSFTFLALNSLHMHSPTHPRPLIEALVVMEVALLYLLYTMCVELELHCSNAVRYFSLIEKLRLGKALKTQRDMLKLAAGVGFLDNLSQVREGERERRSCPLLHLPYVCYMLYTITHNR
jgi:hypothetical protein